MNFRDAERWPYRTKYGKVRLDFFGPPYWFDLNVFERLLWLHHCEGTPAIISDLISIGHWKFNPEYDPRSHSTPPPHHPVPEHARYLNIIWRFVLKFMPNDAWWVAESIDEEIDEFERSHPELYELPQLNPGTRIR